MVSVKLWKELNTFDPMQGGKAFDVDKTVALIAQARDKSVEEVEAMPIEELLPEFLSVVRDVNALVFSRLEQVPKNASGVEGQ